MLLVLLQSQRTTEHDGPLSQFLEFFFFYFSVLFCSVLLSFRWSVFLLFSVYLQATDPLEQEYEYEEEGKEEEEEEEEEVVT